MNYLKCLRYYIEELYHKVTMYINGQQIYDARIWFLIFPKKRTEINHNIFQKRNGLAVA